ncbi:TonB-dependent receptor [Shewanella sp. KX20019]|uniref:TonB-dependent receptor plug domain-containing protein n=1 Tax=Shewanella sp. KX20019 TaxID=2803864 RepID=UPI001927D9CD|nr:TonB-dependent receptor [Shewanella sp. KX20019]QQX79338.1 TonB-dependent receptor [Shewanella sp. KX20019]
MKRCQLAIVIGAVMATAMPSFVFAEEVKENKDSEIEYIQITGSRIQRTDMETVKPVSIITAEDIASTGLNDISNVLALSIFNSAGSSVGATNNSAGNFSASNLRGLGSNRTLTLVNGRRVAGASSLYGSSTNLNMIPIEAVERIEILRDGASSIYGSDAMGGVINIITKSDFEGLTFAANVAVPTQGGGEEYGGSLTFGTASERSSLMFILEHQQQDSLLGGERDNIDGSKNPGRISTRYSPWGSYQKASDDWVHHPSPTCPEENYYERSDGSISCSYDVQEGKYYLPKREKTSAFSNFTYQISDDIEFYTTFLYTDDDSFTSTTPMWAQGYMGADNPNNPTLGSDNPEEVYFMTYLEDSVPREFTFNSQLFDLNSGINYTTDAGFLSINLSYSKDSFNQKSEYYLITDKFQEAVDNGTYNPLTPGGGDLATEEVLDTFRHTQSREGESISQGINIDWSAVLPIELAGGDIAYAIGGEYRDLSVRDEQDSLSNSGNVLGAYGGDTVGERQYQAAYLELELPVLESVVVTMATRYDNYSLPDQGKLSSSAGIRYQPFEDLVLRVSASEGFRVADISEVQGDESVGYYTMVDPKYCNPVPMDERATSDLCEGQNVPVRSFSNQDIEPETSTQYSAGMAWNITEDIDFTADYWAIEIENQITSISATTILDEEYLGNLGNYDGLYVNRDLTEKREDEIIEIGSTVTNYLGSETSGVDMAFNSQHDLGGAGELTFKVEGTYTIESIHQKTSSDPAYDHVGYYSTPEFRASFNAHYSIGDFQAFMTTRYIDGFKGETPQEEANGEEWIDYASMTTFDFGAQYQFEDYGDVSVIFRNAFDTMPSVNTDVTPGYNSAFHSIMGRTIQLTYRKTF